LKLAPAFGREKGEPSVSDSWKRLTRSRAGRKKLQGGKTGEQTATGEAWEEGRKREREKADLKAEETRAVHDRPLTNE